jgi:hypothetical protein
MPVLVPPYTIPIKEDSWTLITPAQKNVSRFTGSRQVQLLPGAHWECQGELAPIVDAARRKAWRAFFASLNGVAGQFQIRTEAAQQTVNANPTVSGAGQTGYSLNLATAVPNGQLLLADGDWMTIPLPTKGTQLVLVTDSNVIAAGVAAISFVPALREAPTNAATVEIRNPYAVVSLKEPMFNFRRDIMLNHMIRLDLEETW